MVVPARVNDAAQLRELIIYTLLDKQPRKLSSEAVAWKPTPLVSRDIYIRRNEEQGCSDFIQSILEITRKVSSFRVSY